MGIALAGLEPQRVYGDRWLGAGAMLPAGVQRVQVRVPDGTWLCGGHRRRRLVADRRVPGVDGRIAAGDGAARAPGAAARRAGKTRLAGHTGAPRDVAARGALPTGAATAVPLGPAHPVPGVPARTLAGGGRRVRQRAHLLREVRARRTVRLGVVGFADETAHPRWAGCHRHRRVRCRRADRRRVDRGGRYRPCRPTRRSTPPAAWSCRGWSTTTRTSRCRSAAPGVATTTTRAPRPRPRAGRPRIVDFCIQYVGGSLKDARAEWHGRADGAAHIDYGFHMAITDARPEVVAEMEQCVAEGITSFKVFMAYKGALMVDDEQFIAVLEQTGKTGGLVMVHCENGDAVVRYQKEAMEAGDTRPEVPRLHAAARGRGRGHGRARSGSRSGPGGRCSSCTSRARRRSRRSRRRATAGCRSSARPASSTST